MTQHSSYYSPSTILEVRQVLKHGQELGRYLGGQGNYQLNKSQSSCIIPSGWTHRTERKDTEETFDHLHKCPQKLQEFRHKVSRKPRDETYVCTLPNI